MEVEWTVEHWNALQEQAAKEGLSLEDLIRRIMIQEVVTHLQAAIADINRSAQNRQPGVVVPFRRETE